MVERSSCEGSLTRGQHEAPCPPDIKVRDLEWNGLQLGPGIHAHGLSHSNATREVSLTLFDAVFGSTTITPYANLQGPVKVQLSQRSQSKPVHGVQPFEKQKLKNCQKYL